MKKILIVEDEPVIQKAITEALRGEGYDVSAVFDADEGAASLGKSKPDLILLDLILPGRSGFEFLQEVKNSAETADIPVIILSNLGDEEEVEQAMKLGASNFLIKADYDLSEVVAIIKKYFVKK